MSDTSNRKTVLQDLVVEAIAEGNNFVANWLTHRLDASAGWAGEVVRQATPETPEEQESRMVREQRMTKLINGGLFGD